MGWWVHDYWQAGLIVHLIAQIFWVIFSITMHELAHGWAALWEGDRTPRELGRMTMNPLVHMGPYSLIAFAIIGIAWGVMPVDPSRFRHGRRGRAIVSAAGPAMNIALALVCIGLMFIWMLVGSHGSDIYNNVTIFLCLGALLNVVLAIFNMLPVPPLDGSGVLSGLSWKAWKFYQNPNIAAYGSLAVLALLFLGGFTVLWIIGGVVVFLPLEFAAGLTGAPSPADILWP